MKAIRAIPAPLEVIPIPLKATPFSPRVFSALLKATYIPLNMFPLLSRVRAFVLPLLEAGYCHRLYLKVG
jgi:hypothetical protein